MSNSPAPPRPACPERGMILRYAHDALADHDRLRIGIHLTGCHRCWNRFLDIQKSRTIRKWMNTDVERFFDRIERPIPL